MKHYARRGMATSMPAVQLSPGCRLDEISKDLKKQRTVDLLLMHISFLPVKVPVLDATSVMADKFGLRAFDDVLFPLASGALRSN